MTKLVAYMKARASFEGVKWDLTENYLLKGFNKGVRNFFGVSLRNNGTLIADTQQPEFFAGYHNKPALQTEEDTKAERIAHKIFTKTIWPAKLTVDEAAEVLGLLARGLVISNADDEDDFEEHTNIALLMHEHMHLALEEWLGGFEEEDETPHAWIVSPQGKITEPVAFLWSGLEGDAVQVLLGTELEAFRKDIADLPTEAVTEGVEGLAMTDPEWDGEEAIPCANPDCNNVHDVHLMLAEALFDEAKQRPPTDALRN